jgi:glyoxylase-like metal-dependent hydrolase (beta-lactamase superfamily II)
VPPLCIIKEQRGEHTAEYLQRGSPLKIELFGSPQIQPGHNYKIFNTAFELLNKNTGRRRIIMKFKNFTIHTYKGYVQNNFLIEYKDKILLLDGACRPDADRIADFIRNSLGRNINDLKLTAVTHCHPDHEGGAVILRNKYHVPAAAPYDIDLWYSGFGGRLQHLSDTVQSQFMAKQMKQNPKSESLFYKRLLNPDYKLHDKSPLPFFDDWEAISAPGHTFHNIMLYNRKSGLLYIADTIISSRGKFLPPIPVLFPTAMKETLLKIKKLKPEMILFAHGDTPIMTYSDNMIDETLTKVDSKKSLFIKFFYLISKFTGEYRKNKEPR